MKEQSHKDEMSAALRGDFQRLRERGVAVTLAPPEPELPTAESVLAEPPTAVSETDVLTKSVSETDPRQDAASDASQQDTEPAAEEEPRGWLGRLLGR